jgi:hypothetical protein
VEAQISLLRQQLTHPRTKLAEIDKVLEDLEKSMPKHSGRWSNRTWELVNITLTLCRNECAAGMTELDEFCKAIDLMIKK